MPTKHILQRLGQPWLVVASCSWGLMLWQVVQTSPGLWKLDLGSLDKLNWHFVVSVKDYKIMTVEAELHQGHGLLFRVGESQCLVRYALLRHLSLRKQEVADLHKELETGLYDETFTLNQLTQTLAEFIFEGNPDLLQKFNQPLPEKDDAEEESVGQRWSASLDEASMRLP